MKRLILLIGVVIIVVALTVHLLILYRQSITFSAMGTTFKITCKGAQVADHLKVAKAKVLMIEKLLDRRDPSSEVSRLNRGEKFKLSDETSRVLELAGMVKKLTGGAFDARYSGKINLDGIGKGFAVEEARQTLLKMGCKSAIIDCTSSIAVIGGPLKVGIKNPRNKGKLLGKITIKDEALSTSGDYEQGKHIIDPKNKSPVDSCQSVTVVMEDAALADGLSTGIFVMGPERGLALAEKLKIKVVIVTRNGYIYEHSGPQLRKFFDKV